MVHTSNENISAALKLLEEAAEQKKDELKSVLSDKYTNLKNLILENETGLMKSLTTAKDHTIEAATQAKDAGVEKVLDMAGELDRSVHQHPWPYLAGSAVFGMLVCFILGRSRK